MTEKSEILTNVLENIIQGVVMFDKSRRVVVWNKHYEQILQFPAGFLKAGMPNKALTMHLAKRGDFGEGDPEQLVADRLDLLWGGSMRPAEITVRGDRTYHVRFQKTDDGGLVVTYTDITERKEMDRMKSEFISTVSHELRTPLTSIKGSLGLLAAGAMGELPEKVKNLVEIAHNNSDRLSLLVEDLLDIQNIESGEMAFDLQLLDLSRLVRDAVESNKAYAETYGVEFILGEIVSDMSVRGDAERLAKVIANLLSNAAKFSPKNEAVEISLSRVGAAARVSVSDRGKGIPDDFRDRIFDRFAQADSSDNRPIGGTGLGLHICKSIVELHRGEIGFHSGEGKGSTFYFTLPVPD